MNPVEISLPLFQFFSDTNIYEGIVTESIVGIGPSILPLLTAEEEEAT